MKYIKLFENYNSNNKIKFVKFTYPILEFGYNGLVFGIDVRKSELIKYKFIDPNSSMFKYLKSNEFVDDLQDKLFERNIMDYSAEEIRYIIAKDGLYSEKHVVDYIIDTLSNLNMYTKKNKPEFKYFGYSEKDSDLYFDYYIDHLKYYSNNGYSYTKEKYIHISIYYPFNIPMYRYLSDSEFKAITYPYIIEKFNIEI